MITILAISGVDALRVLRQYREADTQMRRQFLQRNHVLNNIRSEVYLSGTYIRDYLLEPDPVRAEMARMSLGEVHKKMESELATYAQQLVRPAESADYSALHADLVAYWDVMGPILKLDPRRREKDGYALLRDVVYPRRAAMLDVAGRIADLNEQQLDAATATSSDLLAAFQARTAITLLVSLALGLGMAAFSTRKILQLEESAYARYHEVAEARRQLADLSASLVEAQEAERRSLSRELHDEVGQSLSVVLLELRQMLSGLGGARSDEIRQHAEIIKSQVEGTVRVVRNMALLLRPSMLDDLGLIPALRWQAREVSKNTNLDVSVSTEIEAEDLPDEHKTCIYRVVQEALHNCVRHAHAEKVRIAVQERDGELKLTIQDDGRGFDAKHTKGLGLLGMEERATHLGGTFHVQSAPGQGTTLTLTLPMIQVAKQRDEADTHTVSG